MYIHTHIYINLHCSTIMILCQISIFTNYSRITSNNTDLERFITDAKVYIHLMPISIAELHPVLKLAIFYATLSIFTHEVCFNSLIE